MKKSLISNRRDFLKTGGKASIAAGLSLTILPSLVKANGLTPLENIRLAETPYRQQPLPYAYNALEQIIDAMTMEIHYSKHAAAYAKNLADAVAAESVDTTKVKLEQLLGSVSKYSAKMRNNAGGHYNHELFWKCMRSPMEGAQPSGKLLAAIEKDFNSFDAFKTQFTDAGKNRFGSGWAWLVATADKKLVVSSSPNQDNPLMDLSDVKGVPVMGLDVWEHAYYLKYQNRRPDYINAWWNVVNWDFIQTRFESL
jgi:superoxide dismutase, Fe-Mn family